MASLADLLAQIRQNESSGNYTAQNPSSSASGAYGFINSTWSQLATQAGFGQYANGPASSAPPNVQDSVAAYAATTYDPNSSFLWGASAPAGGYPSVGAGSDPNNPLGSIIAPGNMPSLGGTSLASGQGSFLDQILNGGLSDPNIPGGTSPNLQSGSAGTSATDANGNPVSGSSSALSQIFAAIGDLFQRGGFILLGILLIGIGAYFVAKPKVQAAIGKAL